MQATRRLAREWAIQMLTAADLNPPEDIPSFIATYFEEIGSIEDEDGGFGKEPTGRYRKFAEERVVGVLGSLKEIDESLVPFLEHWDLYRLGTVERTVLRMAAWEMKFAAVPGPVAINEAVDLANWFSTPKSRTFVNGVLDRYAKSL